MPNEDLLNYIKQAKSSGKSDDEIRRELLGAGWQQNDIDDVFNYLNTLLEPPKATPVQTATQLSCPRCGTKAVKGGFAMWQILVAVFFFPIGLLALLAGRKPTVCHKCGYSWQA